MMFRKVFGWFLVCKTIQNQPKPMVYDPSKIMKIMKNDEKHVLGPYLAIAGFASRLVGAWLCPVGSMASSDCARVLASGQVSRMHGRLVLEDRRNA